MRNTFSIWFQNLDNAERDTFRVYSNAPYCWAVVGIQAMVADRAYFLN
jgi:hypothetical protein